MRKFFNIFFVIPILFFVFFSFSQSSEKDLDSEEIILSSEITIKTLLKNSDLQNLRKYIKNSRAILIFPEIYEGSFLFGAKGGSGLLLVRKNENKFSGPFYFTLGGISLGLQFGLKSGRVVMTIMTNRGLKSILKERIKFGVDVDYAAINFGTGYSAESTVRLADIYSFSDNSGLFFGGSLEGSYLQPRNDLNFAIHNKQFLSDEILKTNTLNDKAKNLAKLISDINDDTK